MYSFTLMKRNGFYLGCPGQLGGKCQWPLPVCCSSTPHIEVRSFNAKTSTLNCWMRSHMANENTRVKPTSDITTWSSLIAIIR